MNDTESKKIISSLLNKLDKPRRKTAGHNKSKNYHKVTISVDEKMKADIVQLAKEADKSISAFIKDLVTEEKKKKK